MLGKQICSGHSGKRVDFHKSSRNETALGKMSFTANVRECVGTFKTRENQQQQKITRLIITPLDAFICRDNQIIFSDLRYFSPHDVNYAH